MTDTFGDKLWITPANAGDDEDWRRWSMFGLDTLGADPVAAETSLLVPPSVPKVADGPVLEDVSLIRDETANMVWGIEETVRLPTGESRRGSEVAAEILAFRRKLDEQRPPDPDPARAAVAYEAMSTVPEQWIPFIAVHRDSTVHRDQGERAIQLQRAAMPGFNGRAAVQPRTQLLREGLDAGKAYYIEEEEVPESGTRVQVSYNRTRWRDGRVVVWLGARRGAGRGEGSSGLRFDSLADTS